MSTPYSSSLPVVLGLCLIAGCGEQTNKSGIAVRSNIADLTGKTYSRVVSLSPNLTEMLFAAHAGESMVGRSEFCDFPNESLQLPAVGGGVQPDSETILSLRPDLVVCLAGMRNTLPLDLFAQAGIDVYWTNVESFEDISRTLTELGRLVDRQEEASEAVRRFDSGVRETAGIGKGQRVVMVHGHRPLVVAGAGSWGDELLVKAGYVNAAGGLQRPYPVVDGETLLSLNPDVIVDTSFPGEDEDPRSFWEQFRSDKSTERLNIVFWSVGAGLRPGPRAPEAIRSLAEAVGESLR